VRTDAAHVELDTVAGALTARGTSAVADYALDWTLAVGPGWITRRLSVRARNDGWSTALELTRSDGGVWAAVRRSDEEGGGGGRGEPVAMDMTGLDGALDCDLGLCPLTNTMPIRRHDLVAAARAGGGPGVELVMAWIDVPTLTVHVSPQTYTPLGPAADGGALIGFASEGFAATLDVDTDGLVRRYPGIAARLAPPAHPA
jgi:hypothetical protein